MLPIFLSPLTPPPSKNLSGSAEFVHDLHSRTEVTLSQTFTALWLQWVYRAGFTCVALRRV